MSLLFFVAMPMAHILAEFSRYRDIACEKEKNIALTIFITLR